MHIKYDEQKAGTCSDFICMDEPRELIKDSAKALDKIRQERETNKHCTLPLTKMFEV